MEKKRGQRVGKVLSSTVRFRRTTNSRAIRFRIRVRVPRTRFRRTTNSRGRRFRIRVKMPRMRGVTEFRVYGEGNKLFDDNQQEVKAELQPAMIRTQERKAEVQAARGSSVLRVCSPPVYDEEARRCFFRAPDLRPLYQYHLCDSRQGPFTSH